MIGQQSSLFEKVEASRMMYMDVQENINKLAKFFQQYSKKKEVQMDNGWVGMKQDNLVYLSSKLKQINKNIETFVGEYENIFDECTSERSRNIEEKDQEMLQLKKQFQQEKEQMIQKFEKKLKNLKKEQKQNQLLANSASNHKDVDSSRFTIEQLSSRVYQPLNNMTNELNIFDKISPINQISQYKSVFLNPNRQKMKKQQIQQNEQQNQQQQQQGNGQENLYPCKEIQKECLLLKKNRQNNDKKLKMVDGKIEEKKEEDTQEMNFSEKQNESHCESSEKREFRQQSSYNPGNVDQSSLIFQNQQDFENSKDFSQLSIFANNLQNNIGGGNGDINLIDQSNMSMQKCEGRWDSQLESDSSHDMCSGINETVDIKNAIQVLQDAHFLDPQNIALLQKLSDCKDNPVDKQSYLEFMMQIMKLRKTKQLNLNSEIVIDDKEVDGKKVKLKQKKELLKKEIKNKFNLKQNCNNNQSKNLDVSLSELLAVQEMSFQSPLPSLRNNNNNSNVENLEYNHVELEDIMKAKTIPDEISSLLRDVDDQDLKLKRNNSNQEDDNNNSNQNFAPLQDVSNIQNNILIQDQNDKVKFCQQQRLYSNSSKQNQENMYHNEQANSNYRSRSPIDLPSNQQLQLKQQSAILQKKFNTQTSLSSLGGSSKIMSQQRNILYKDSEILVEDENLLKKNCNQYLQIRGDLQITGEDEQDEDEEQYEKQDLKENQMIRNSGYGFKQRSKSQFSFFGGGRSMMIRNQFFNENEHNYYQNIIQFGEHSEPIICLNNESEDIQHNFSSKILLTKEADNEEFHLLNHTFPPNYYNLNTLLSEEQEYEFQDGDVSSSSNIKQGWQNQKNLKKLKVMNMVFNNNKNLVKNVSAISPNNNSELTRNSTRMYSSQLSCKFQGKILTNSNLYSLNPGSSSSAKNNQQFKKPLSFSNQKVMHLSGSYNKNQFQVNGNIKVNLNNNQQFMAGPIESKQC